MNGMYVWRKKKYWVHVHFDKTIVKGYVPCIYLDNNERYLTRKKEIKTIIEKRNHVAV